MRASDFARRFNPKLGTAAHQFFDECLSNALRAANHNPHEFPGNIQPAGVQLGAGRLVEQGKLNCLIDASRTQSQGRLSLVGTIRGQNEQNFGILTEAVHLV
jgi:hypothetical protein